MSDISRKNLLNPILTSFRGMLFQKQTVLFCDGHVLLNDKLKRDKYVTYWSSTSFCC